MELKRLRDEPEAVERALWASRRMLRRRLGFGLLDPALPSPLVLARPAQAPLCRTPLLSEVAEPRCDVADMDWISLSAPPRTEEPKRPAMRTEFFPGSQYYFAPGRHCEHFFLDLSIPGLRRRPRHPRAHLQPLSCLGRRRRSSVKLKPPAPKKFCSSLAVVAWPDQLRTLRTCPLPVPKPKPRIHPRPKPSPKPSLTPFVGSPHTCQPPTAPPPVPPPSEPIEEQLAGGLQESVLDELLTSTWCGLQSRQAERRCVLAASLVRTPARGIGSLDIYVAVSHLTHSFVSLSLTIAGLPCSLPISPVLRSASWSLAMEVLLSMPPVPAELSDYPPIVLDVSTPFLIVARMPDVPVSPSVRASALDLCLSTLVGIPSVFSVFSIYRTLCSPITTAQRRRLRRRQSVQLSQSQPFSSVLLHSCPALELTSQLGGGGAHDSAQPASDQSYQVRFTAAVGAGTPTPVPVLLLRDLQYNFTVHPTPAKGDCFFSSAAEAMNRFEGGIFNHTPHSVRATLLDVADADLSLNPDVLQRWNSCAPSGVVRSGVPSAQLPRLRNGWDLLQAYRVPGTWVDNILIPYFTRAFPYHLVIVSPRQDTAGRAMPPSISLLCAGRMPSVNNSTVVLKLYGRHYETLLPPIGSSVPAFYEWACERTPPSALPVLETATPHVPGLASRWRQVIAARTAAAPHRSPVLAADAARRAAATAALPSPPTASPTLGHPPAFDQRRLGRTLAPAPTRSPPPLPPPPSGTRPRAADYFAPPELQGSPETWPQLSCGPSHRADILRLRCAISGCCRPMGSTGKGFAGFAGYHQHVSTSHKGVDPDSLLNVTLPLDVATHQPLSDPQAAQFTGLHNHSVPLRQTLPPATVLPTSGLPTSPTATLSSSNLFGDAEMVDEDEALFDDVGLPDTDALMPDVPSGSPPPPVPAALPPPEATLSALLRCNVQGCPRPLGTHGLGYKGLGGYHKHLGMHKDADISHLSLVTNPTLVSTGQVVNDPRAAAIIGLIVSPPSSAVTIQFLSGFIAPSCERLVRRTAATAADLRLVAHVDVAYVLKLRLLSHLHWCPFQCRQLYSQVLVTILRLMAAVEDARSCAGWHLWLLHIRMLYYIPVRGTKLSWQTVQERMERFLVGDWEALLLDYLLAYAQAERRLAEETAERLASRHNGTDADDPSFFGSESVPAQTPPIPVPAANFKSAERHVAVGNVHSSRSALENTASITAPVTADGMQACHFDRRIPLARDADGAIELHQPRTAHVVDRDVLASSVRGMAKHKAAGPGLARTDHVCPMVLDYDDVLEALVPVVQRFINGDIQPGIMSLLTTANLFSVVQPGKPDERPITCNEWFLRAAWRYMMRVAKPALLKTCEPIQLGLSRNGCDKAVHAAQLYGRAHRHLAAVFYDIRKAFQEMSRQRMFDQVMAHPQIDWIIPALRLTYLNDSALYLQLASGIITTLLSKEGVRQGASEASAMFDLTTMAALSNVYQAVGADEEELVAFLVCIADDTMLFCEPDAVVQTLQKMEAELATQGNVLNYTKTTVLYLHGVLPAAVRASGVRCVDLLTPEHERGLDPEEEDETLKTLGVKHLGIPWGTSAYMHAWLERKLSDMQRSLNLLAGMRLHLHGALHILRLSHIAQMTYLCRCLPPYITVPYMQRFDNMVLDCVATLIGVVIPAGHPALQQIRLKVSLGGLGLISAAKVAPAAFAASVIDSMDTLLKLGKTQNFTAGTPPCTYFSHVWQGGPGSVSFLLAANDYAASNLDRADELLSAASPLHYDLVTALRLLPPASFTVFASYLRGMDLSLAANSALGLESVGAATPHLRSPPADAPADIEEHDPTGFQRLLATAIHKADEATYRVAISTDPARAAQHLSQCPNGPRDSGVGFLATQWLLIHPARQLIPTNTMRSALLLYLGLPDLDAAPPSAACPCGAALSADTAFTHFWSCTQHSTTAVPHNHFGNAFDCIYRQLPGRVAISNLKKDCAVRNNKYADKRVTGIITTVGRRLLQDQTVAHPGVQAHLHVGSSITANVAADAAHQKKLSHYANSLNDQTDILFPVAVEVFGGVHKSVIKQFRHWAADVASAKGVPRMAGIIFHGWRIHLSCALMEGRVAFYQASITKSLEPGGGGGHQQQGVDKQSFVERYSSQRSARTTHGCS